MKIGVKEALELAVVTLASSYPEDALKFFSEEEILEMGEKSSHLIGLNTDVFEVFRNALNKQDTIV